MNPTCLDNMAKVQPSLGFYDLTAEHERRMKEMRSMLELMKEYELTKLSYHGFEFTKQNWVKLSAEPILKKLTPEEQLKLQEEELFWSARG